MTILLLTLFLVFAVAVIIGVRRISPAWLALALAAGVAGVVTWVLSSQGAGR